MTFLNLLGLLGLLSLVLLAIIYIIKPKYLEKSISSSFIWKLSLKYKKKKIPFEWLKSSLILILQILILVTMTMILMKPNAVLATKNGEKIVILDVSASMLAESNGTTRLDRAIKEIDDLAKTTLSNNDKFSLIITGQESEILVQRSDSYEFVKSKLYTIDDNYSISNIDEAMLLTEDILKINPTAEILYYTSTDYNDPGNVEIHNMSKDELNVAILDFKGEYDLSLNYIFTVQIASYGQDLEDVIVQLNVDGDRETSATVDLQDGVIFTLTFKVPGLNADTFDVASVELLEVVDDFSYDNELTYYSNQEPFKVQIVNPLVVGEINSTKEYVTRALSSLSRSYSVASVNEIDNALNTGFDLYIYIETVPEVLPEDGAIWIFNPIELPENLEMVVGDEVLDNNLTLSGETSLNPSYQSILENVRPEKITIAKHKEITNYDNYEVLLHSNGNPVLLTRDMDGVKVTIFTIDLAYSNLPILFFDFPVLIQNLSNYSVIPTFEKDIYDSGTAVSLHANPMTELITITTDDGTKQYSKFPDSTPLSTLGTYQLEQTFRDGRIKSESFYVRVPMSESKFDYVGDVITAPLIQGATDVVYQNDNLKDLLAYFSIALLLLVIIEWEVQSREQY